MRLTRRRAALLAVVSICLVAGCGSTARSATERDKAEQLVTKTRAAGVAPELTAETAESLYGDDASAVCDAFDGGLSTTGRLLLLGNPSGRRTKTITADAVTYARLVVETYCPDVLPDFDKEVSDLDPVESS
jgi:hypothetical protein